MNSPNPITILNVFLGTISHTSPQEEMFDVGKLINTTPPDKLLDVINLLLEHYAQWFLVIAVEFYKLDKKTQMRAIFENWGPKRIANACKLDGENYEFLRYN